MMDVIILTMVFVAPVIILLVAYYDNKDLGE